MQGMRPRFMLAVPLGVADVHARLLAQVDCEVCPCAVVVAGHHVEVMICERLHRAWSPRLSLEITPHEEGALLKGLYGPNPNIWTMFAAAQAFAIFTALFGGVFGLVQYSLDLPAWGLWSLAAAGLLSLSAYLGSRVGQFLAAGQMRALRGFLTDSLDLTPEAAASGEVG